MYKNEDFFINCHGTDIHSTLDYPADQKEKMPVMVLISGFTGYIEEDHIIAIKDAANEAGYVVLRSELYGHGKSGGDFYDHNLLLWTAETMCIIRYAMNLPFAGDVVLAGHSQGGLTAVLAGGIMSDLIKALIPLSPALCIPYDAKRGSILGNEFDPEDLPEKLVSPDGWELGTDYVRVARLIDTDKTVKSYKGPVLVVHGAEDEVVPFRFAEELAEKYENGRLISIENADHCFTGHFDELKKVIRDYLTEILNS
ncbi:MAG: alpha/beta fold hydrolase [Lachnospiraceae bacterium]|nr:alpha/beta fold hydrolase [Lachnospiraceae bacterium]